MFLKFCTNLCNILTQTGFALVPNTNNTDRWLMQAVDGSSNYILLIMVNNLNSNWDELHSEALRYNQAVENSEKTDSIRSITSVCLLIDGEVPPWDNNNVAGYYGDYINTVFWHLNTETGIISAPTSHPTKLFGLHSKINTALVRAKSDENANAELQEINKQESEVPLKNKFPIVTFGLIAINLLVLLLMYHAGYRVGYNRVPFEFGGLYRELVIYEGEWYRLFTSMFIHFGFQHFFLNGIGMLIFGIRIEQYIGRVFYLLVYLVTGLVGAFFSLFITLANNYAISAGASGAVYGLVGTLLAFTFITKRKVGSLNWVIILMYVGFGVLSSQFTGVFNNANIGNIDNMAHIGGAIAGVIMGGIYGIVANRAVVK